jgi:uncharacterized protein (DUF1330 family)
MPAYVVAQVQMRDPFWVDEYVTKIQPVLQKHGGRYLVRAGGKLETLEGAAPLPNALVILEFPSMEQARAWYHDPEYAPLIKLRQRGSDVDAILVEAV